MSLLEARLREARGRGTPYDFFESNCTTRIRDLLNGILLDALRKATAGNPSGSTRRQAVAGYTANAPLLHLVIHSLLGSSVDAPMDRWEALFLPEALADGLVDAGLVTSDRRLRPDGGGWTPPAPRGAGGPGWLLLGLLAGVVVAGAPVRVGAGLGAAASLAAGLVGLAILALQATSLNTLMAGNMNGWMLNPLWLLVALGAWGRSPLTAREVILAGALTATSALLLAGSLTGSLSTVAGPLGLLVVPLHAGVTVHLLRQLRRACPAHGSSG